MGNLQIIKNELSIYKKQFGVYPCEIRMNFCCSSELTFIRDAGSIFDNNAFVTLWVSSILLEAARFLGGPLPSDKQLLYALDAISIYHDKNRALEDGILVFWPQTYNSTAGVWSCSPENLENVDVVADDVLIHLHKAVDDLRLKDVWNKFLGPFQQFV